LVARNAILRPLSAGGIGGEGVVGVRVGESTAMSATQSHEAVTIRA
jgi:hypothetical protein